MLKSARQARYMTGKIPGVVVPRPPLTEELERASNPAEDQCPHHGGRS